MQPPTSGPLHDRGHGRGRGHGHDHGHGHGRVRGERKHQSGLLQSWPFWRISTKVQPFVCLIIRHLPPFLPDCSDTLSGCSNENRKYTSHALYRP